MSEQLDLSIRARRRLILVSAMAGAGKSSLVTAWAAKSGLPFAWLSLDARDNALPVFWAYLVSAVQRTVPAFAQSLLTQLLSPQPPAPETVVTEFLNQAEGLTGPLVIVLDDYHLIENAAIHQSLVSLVEHLPPTLLLVLCTRSDPPMPLSRWRVRGYLTEIRADHLRFTEEEAASFLRSFMSLRLDDEDVHRLEASTEGWAAGLQMAGLALQNLSAASVQERQAQKTFIARFSANDQYVFDYLTSEVLNQQQPEIRDFLLQTSIAKQLCGPLCQAITGNPESAEILVQLRQKNLFVIPLDSSGDWFRYHHLFADLLQARLARRASPEELAGLHLGAARWYEQESLNATASTAASSSGAGSSVDDALYHALQAKAFDYAAEIVNRSWRLATDRGWPNQALRWLESLPGDAVKDSPSLSLAAACTQWIRGKAEETQRHCENALDAYRRWLAQSAGPSGDADFDTIPSQAAAMQALVAVRRERLDEALRLSNEAVALSSAASPGSVGLAYQSLATALRDLGQFEEAIQAYRTAIPSFEKTGNRITVTNSSFNLGRLLIVQGRLDEAQRFFEDALRKAGPHMTPADGILQVYLGEIHYERSRLDEAQALFEQAWGPANKSGYLELIKNGGILNARLLRAKGDLPGALAVLDEAAEIVGRTDARSLLGEIQSVRAVFQAEAGQLAKALDWARAFQPRITTALSAGHMPGLSTGFQGLNYARVLLAAGELDSVLAFAAAFVLLAESSGSLLWQTEALLLQAAALRGKSAKDAQTPLLGALALAQQTGCLRTFVDRGQAVRALLESAYPTISDPTMARYAGQILEAFSAKEPAAPASTASSTPGEPSALSEREAQVLRLLSVGLSNQEIAERLVISLATTKTHIRHIFEKLDAQNRVDAVNRAKERGLL